MKSFWRTKPDGSKVLVDDDPTNSYDDGYNAGCRSADPEAAAGQTSNVLGGSSQAA